MNAFDQGRMVEMRGKEILLPYLREISDGQYVLIERGALARWLQVCVGDVVMARNGRMVAVELKCEEKHTGNVFLEVWSNRNLEDRQSHGERGQNPGWMVHLRADWLLYYFLDKDQLYAFDMFELKRWLFGSGESDGAWRDSKLRQVVQSKHVQLNQTCGVLAPLMTLYEQLPHGAMRWTTVRQRELREATRQAGGGD